MMKPEKRYGILVLHLSVGLPVQSLVLLFTITITF